MKNTFGNGIGIQITKVNGIKLFIDRLYKIIRTRQTQIVEIITSNQVKDWNDYQNHLGQLDTLNYIEQELSDLLKKQEQNE